VSDHPHAGGLHRDLSSHHLTQRLHDIDETRRIDICITCYDLYAGPVAPADVAAAPLIDLWSISDDHYLVGRCGDEILAPFITGIAPDLSHMATLGGVYRLGRQAPLAIEIGGSHDA